MCVNINKLLKEKCESALNDLNIAISNVNLQIVNGIKYLGSVLQPKKINKKY